MRLLMLLGRSVLASYKASWLRTCSGLMSSFCILVFSFRLMCSSTSFYQLNDLSNRRFEEATKLKEIHCREEKVKELARQEKERSKSATKEAEYTRTCAEREASQRQEAELKAMRDAKEKERLQNALVGPVQQYQKFTWEEIVSATSSFCNDFKIGMGAYGTVYKCSLHHTTAAVKVLHSKDNKNSKQFQQEVWKFHVFSLNLY